MVVGGGGVEFSMLHVLVETAAEEVGCLALWLCGRGDSSQPNRARRFGDTLGVRGVGGVHNWNAVLARCPTTWAWGHEQRILDSHTPP